MTKRKFRTEKVGIGQGRPLYGTPVERLECRFVERLETPALEKGSLLPCAVPLFFNGLILEWKCQHGIGIDLDKRMCSSNSFSNFLSPTVRVVAKMQEEKKKNVLGYKDIKNILTSRLFSRKRLMKWRRKAMKMHGTVR